MNQRTAFVFTANTPQVAQANLMLESLRDPQRGNFEGDIWVISTGLSERAKSYLDSQEINYLISKLNYVYEWKDWKKVAEAQPEYHEFSKKANKEIAQRQAFQFYRNKRLSKLIIIDWVKKFGSQYDFIALGDNDLYFQRDVNELFAKAHARGEDQVHFWQEEFKIQPGSNLWKKDFHYIRLHDAAELDFGTNEINIGFILGKPQQIKKVFENVKKYFFELNSDLFACYAWHDQDLVRLDKAKRPEAYKLLDEGEIVHLCNGGDRVISEDFPMEFFHTKTKRKPYIVHFAGGAWKKYPSVAPSYKVDEDNFYFTNESVATYSKIRTGSLISLFDEPSVS